MGKSQRKTPILGMAGSKRAQKKFRTYEHQAERTKINQILNQTMNLIKDAEALINIELALPHPKEYGNEWASPRDGKVWHGQYKNDPTWKEMFKKWMRK